MKKLFPLFIMALILAFCIPCYAEENAPLTSDKFTIYIDVLRPEGVLLESALKFNLSIDDNNIASGEVLVSSKDQLSLEIPVPKYEIGTKFKVVLTEGAESLVYYTDTFYPGEAFTAETYAYKGTDGNVVISDSVHISIMPSTEPWDITAEKFAKANNFDSNTDYLIWVSKNNYTVSVFLKRDYGWDCIRQIACSIGAPSTPTVTGEFTYYQYHNRWSYNKYYVGPVMRFYNGYAIHSTLVNYDETDYDARLGKKISLGCVRVLPKDARWLTDYVPLGTKIYVTEE